MIIYYRTAEDSRCLKERKNTFYADAYRGKIDTKVWLINLYVFGYRGFFTFISIGGVNLQIYKEVHHSWQKLN